MNALIQAIDWHRRREVWPINWDDDVEPVVVVESGKALAQQALLGVLTEEAAHGPKYLGDDNG